jgi:hypothetical protein
MHMWPHVTNHLITSNDKDSNSENRIKLRVRDNSHGTKYLTQIFSPAVRASVYTVQNLYSRVVALGLTTFSSGPHDKNAGHNSSTTNMCKGVQPRLPNALAGPSALPL